METQTNPPITWSHWTSFTWTDARARKRIQSRPAASETSPADATNTAAAVVAASKFNLTGLNSCQQRWKDDMERLENLTSLAFVNNQTTVCDKPVAPPSVPVQDFAPVPDAPSDLDSDMFHLSPETLDCLNDDWDMFSMDNLNDLGRLDIALEAAEAPGAESLPRTMQCVRELGVMSYFDEGFKVLAADGFSCNYAFPMKLTWCDGKLYGVITKPFVGYPNFDNQVKLFVPKALKDEMNTAEALAVLLFYFLRQKFCNHAVYSYLIDSQFFELGPEVLSNFKNVKFTELVKSYAYVLFAAFEKVAKTMEAPIMQALPLCNE